MNVRLCSPSWDGRELLQVNSISSRIVWLEKSQRGGGCRGCDQAAGNERADERLMACCLPASPNLEHSKSFLDARINFRFRPRARTDLRWTGGHLSGMLYKHTSARSAFKSLDKE